ncbi:MAG: GGDEF domain-containing protein [Saprospiraceae bacterium]|nr:GGDEF domain-containing protein [Saprospiraceae bacterium]
MLKLLTNGLLIAGACVLIGSLIPVRNLITQLPSGQVRRCWYELTVLIVLLIAGYTSYTVTFWNRHSNWSDFIVPSVFFFGAIFVWLTTSLSLQTAFDIRRVTLLEQESITDPLLGIYNRRYLDRRLDEEISRAKRYNLPLSILLIDIDHFKQINDTYGHAIGDELLSHLGKILTNTIRNSDVAARYGGDELLILAQNTPASSAGILGERLRQHVESNKLVSSGKANQQKEIHATVSIGVAGLDPEVTDSKGLIQCADEALYMAKQEGRNCVIIHDINMTKSPASTT